MTTLEKVREIILRFKKKVNPEALQAEANFRTDLNFDSLDLMELLVDAEDAFSITIDLDDVSKLHTLGDIVAYIDEKCSA